MALIDDWKELGFHHKTAEKFAKLKWKPDEMKSFSEEKLVKELGFSEAGAKEFLGKLTAGPKPKETAAKEVKEDAAAKPEKKGKAAKEDEADPSQLSLKERLKIAQGLVKKSGGTIGIASEMKELDYGKTSTGHKALDQIMGGGWPVGKFSLIYGPSQSGKSLTCLDTIASDQKADPNAIWVWMDAENSFDKVWAEKQGVDLTRLVIIPNGIADDMFTDCEDVIRAIAPKGVIVDSIGALISWQEVMKDRDDKTYTKEISADTMALTARFLGKFYRRFTHMVAKHHTTFVLITHVYAVIGERFAQEMAKGGNAMMHFSHVMMETGRRKGDQDKKQKIRMPDGRELEIFTAYEMTFTTRKTRQSGTEGHKIAIPFIYGKGLSEIDSVIEMAIACGVIQRNDAYYTHPMIAQVHTSSNGWIHGREKMFDFVKSHEDCFKAILEDVGAKMAADDAVPDEESADDSPPAD